ncbi:glycosyltransferase family 2 protein [Solitalea lacus]|uniref:glycosyltransferase family 2 protein n=1 Tax=Solitalea lacus TaxID=2911172 RepID=UPI001EDBB450|nr:glycosyltransferase family 2 protein [Solitalea lacus]UKJ07074.1 glycosyltransferase [Solitalea lacus]
MKIKVSVIIPVYNVSIYLDKCLSSAINQTLKEIEIIVVNDGSTDDSSKVIQQYALIDKRIIVINKLNEGLPYARKSGIEKAQGEFIYHLDGDDYLELNGIEELYIKAQKTNADIVVGDFILNYLDLNKKEIIRYADFGELDNQDFLCQLIKWKQFFSCGKLIRSNLYKLNNIEFIKKISYGEDNVSMSQLVYNSKKIVKSNIVVFNYVQRNSSISNKVSYESSKQLLTSSMFVRNFLLSKPIKNQLKSHLLYFNLRNIYNYFQNNRKIDLYQKEIKEILNSGYERDVELMKILKVEPFRVRVVLKLLQTHLSLALIGLHIFLFLGKIKNLNKI